ncbi:EAL domain-containing protein [Vibrio sp. CAU 1672]|uniref:sensor domain-containing phosphodiesterase n=1 Tax=Vibrio sp. CAU 1672 TaxID=3032594 RepID=UPI0023D9E225|nr:EAL domain-containing protein [Vibrio sp. CAU 1672]MDF2153382.1 EAL domain-containing protein [Vibrio sp. CAU 1672]
MSDLFVITADRVHVLSFTAAFVVAALLRYRWRAIPAISSGLFCHYLFVSGRGWEVALLFAFALPLLPMAFCTLYQRLVKTADAYNFTLKFGYYLAVLGILYPVANTAMLWSFSLLLDWPTTSSLAFISYSVLSGILTHIMLTPVVAVGFSYVLDTRKLLYASLDRAMRQANPNQLQFRVWLALCGILLLVGLFTQNTLALNTTSLMILCLVGFGLGKFGLLIPMVISILTLLSCIESVVARYNQGFIEQQVLYEVLLVLFVLSMLIFMLGAHTVKNFVTTRNAILRERVDTYTGMYNLAQLKEDIADNPSIVLLYLDLKPTLSKLNGLGHRGQAQLMKQLSNFLTTRTPDIKRCYLPPFASGLVCSVPYSPWIESKLSQLSALLDQFHFYFEGSSIRLVKHTIHCTKVTPGQDVGRTVSHLCDEISEDKIRINWLSPVATEQTKLDKLSFIQNCFRKNKFELYCQPYLPLGNNTVGAYFEVLLRLNNDDQSTLPPAEFFPLINEFGLETELDEWVINKTFETLNGSIDDWDCLGRCSINLTAKALNTQTLAASIKQLAATHHIPMSKICFELTESDALRNESIAIENIALLREAGCTIALDDFGTGYASFDYLRRLPLDVLKVDGSFVRNMPENAHDQIIVRTISQVAKSMSLTTVAEFAESPAHINLLRQLDIQFAQGYGVAKPLPLSTHLKHIKATTIATTKNK